MLDFLNEANWWCLLLLLLLSFLLGWFLSKRSVKKKYEEELASCKRQNEILQKTGFKNKDKTFIKPDLEENELKAIKTRERSGAIVTNDTNKTDNEDNTISVENPIEKPTLNFDSFGKADASEKDDLKLISGIGPFIENKLNGIGIYTFDQISKFTKQDIETVTALIEFFPGRIERDNWKDQAKELKNKK